MQSQPAAGDRPLSTAIEPRLSRPSLDVPPPSTSISHPASASLLFLDPSLPNASSLLAEVQAKTEVFVLDPTKDEIEQITQVLRERSGISSLHIVSYGSSGALQFGSSSLNLDTIKGYRRSLEAWGSALAPEADVLLYGSNVAQGEAGEAFINRIAQLTRAEVAASNNATGSAVLGGDWTLEVNTGEIAATIGFQSSVVAYQNVLTGSSQPPRPHQRPAGRSIKST